jgi:nucleoside-diphosphate-sugar epimerase
LTNFRLNNRYINAAKQANIEHIVFPTPFSKLDTPYSPPLTPIDDKDKEELANATRSYRNQFEAIETMLQKSFSQSQITILRYPGVLNQHLLYFANYIIEKSKLPSINSHMIFECCDLNDVVRALCHILFCPVERHGGKEYKITGPNLFTIDEIAVKASLGLKREIDVEFMSIKQLRDVLMETTTDKEEVAYLLELWGLQGYLGASRKVQVTRDLEIITGSSGKSLREFFENSYSAFSSSQTG